MAKMMDIKDETYFGESKTFDSFRNNLPDDVICYYNRQVYGKQFDFCLIFNNLGLLVVEVKGWNANSIKSIKSPDLIEIEGYDLPQKSPLKQASSYRFNILNLIQERCKLNPCVLEMVCYPFISEVEYKKIGLGIVSEPNKTLFKEDIENKNLLIKKIVRLFQTQSKFNSDKMNKSCVLEIRKLFENEETYFDDEKIDYSNLSIFPNGISLVQIDEIINNYFKGVKQIVFVNDQEVLKKIIDNLLPEFNKRNIVFESGSLSISSESMSISEDSTKVSFFNFEVYEVNGLNKITEMNIKISNGENYENYYKLLCKLSEKTEFNLCQYMVEHAPVGRNMQIKAGAGTGKTYSMISRISFLCSKASKSGIKNPAEEIAMMTFTVQAATNMKSRLKKQFMNYFILTRDNKYLDLITSIEEMKISTIHSFAKDVIKKTSTPIGVGTDFATVSGNYEKKKILKKVLSDYLVKKSKEDTSFFFDMPVNAYKMEDIILEFIKKIYEKGCNIKEITKDSFGKLQNDEEYLNGLFDEVIKNVELEYANLLIENNSINLSEYMLYLNKCINDTSFNKNNFMIKYLFIDEFQDVDDAQMNAFLKMQEKLNFLFFIVGDLKQSIYRFRGATMDAFTKMGCLDVKRWDSYSLNINYRSDADLLNKYDQIFKRMGEKFLIPYGPDDNLKGVKHNDIPLDKKIVMVKYDKKDVEKGLFYDKLFDAINDRKKELEIKSKEKHLTIPEKTIAILVRTNNQIKEISSAGKDRGIMIESETGENLYKLQSSIDLCKLTAALCNPYNEIYLFDLLMSNNVNIEFNPNSIAGMDAEAKKTLFIKCLDSYYSAVMNKSWSALIYEVQNKPVLKVLRNIYESTKPWKTYSKSSTFQNLYRMNYDLLFEELISMNKKSYLTLNSINEMVTIAISTGMEKKSRELQEDNDCVKVICETIHASKGLEFDTVILPKTVDKIDVLKKNAIEINYLNDIGNHIGYYVDLNGKELTNEYFNSDDEIKENIMEESRNLYVALTRAINKLVWFKEVDNNEQNWGNLLEEVKDGD